jgi:hypothetical protein
MEVMQATQPAIGTQSADFTGTLPACGTAVLSDGTDESGQGMSDADLEDAIRRCGIAMEAAYSQYRLYKRQADLDRAHYHVGQQKILIGRRSPEQVARMEAERGLA